MDVIEPLNCLLADSEDCQGLNNVMVKYSYPYPLIHTALEQILKSQDFYRIGW